MSVTLTPQAEDYFNAITKGRRTAVKRPKNSGSDRRLRKMIEEAQRDGRIIINSGGGYYEPDLKDEVEVLEYRHYINAKKSRIKKMWQTIQGMEAAAENQMMGQIHFSDGFDKLPEELEETCG